MSNDMLAIIHGAATYVAIPVGLLIAVCTAGKYQYSKVKGISYGAALIAALLLFPSIPYNLALLFDIELSANSARVFLFVPLFTFVFGRIWKIGTLQGADFITPMYFAMRAVFLLGCVFWGCGDAIPVEWGIYSPAQECNVFPMTFLDCVLSVVIAIYSGFYARKLKYQGQGRVFGRAMIIMGIVRFHLQFGSLDYWGVRGFNEDTVYSLLAVLIGVIIFAMQQTDGQDQTNG